MAKFKFIINADQYPSEYNIEASSWPVGMGKAIKLWKKSVGKGSRSREISIKGFKIVSLDKVLTIK